MRNITILPVPMRIDRTQNQKVDEGLAFAADRFEELPAGMSAEERHAILGRGRGTVPAVLRLRGDARRLRRHGPVHRPRCFPPTSGSSAASPEARSRRCRPGTNGCACAPGCCSPARRHRSPREVVLDFSPEDQLWAEWIAAVLGSAGITVRLGRRGARRSR